jgi:hypothetical protein
MNYEPLPQKIKRGWSLTRSSWALVCQKKTLLIVPLIWFVVWLVLLLGYCKVGLGVYIQKEGPGAYYLGSHISFWALPWLLVFYVAIMLINTLFTAVIAHQVLRRLAGNPVSLADSLRAVRQRFGLLGSFSLLSSGISFVLVNTLGRIPFAHGLLGWLSNTSWAIGAAFAIPAIMAAPEPEKQKPLKAVKTSVSVIKKGWGEGVTYKTAISGIGLLVIAATYAVGTLVERVLYIAMDKSEAVVIGGAITAVLLFLAEYLAFGLLSVVAKTALYMYTTDDTAPEGFDKAMLHATVTRSKARKLFS